MYYLYGIRENVGQHVYGGPFETTYTEELVATFDYYDDAKAYAERNRLKNPKTFSYSGTVNFRTNSLLEGCYEYEIREDHIEHNPK